MPTQRGVDQVVGNLTSMVARKAVAAQCRDRQLTCLFYGELHVGCKAGANDAVRLVRIVRLPILSELLG